MLKIELENRDFRKSLYFYIVDAEKKRKKEKKRFASGCWHFMKFSGFVYRVKDYCCANFRNQQSF